MPKTSSTKSAKPKKGEVAVDSSSRNRAKPVNKYELNSGDNNGSGHSGNFNKISLNVPKLMCPLASFTSMFKTSLSLDLSTSVIQSAVK